MFVFWIYFESRARHNFLAYGLSDVEESTQKYKLGQICVCVSVCVYIYIYTHTHTHISISDYSKVHYWSCGSSRLSIRIQSPLLCFSDELLGLDDFFLDRDVVGFGTGKYLLLLL